MTKYDQRSEFVCSVIWIIVGLILIIYPIPFPNIPVAMLLPNFDFKSRPFFLTVNIFLSIMIFSYANEFLMLGNYAIPIASLLLIICGLCVVYMNNFYKSQH